MGIWLDKGKSTLLDQELLVSVVFYLEAHGLVHNLYGLSDLLVEGLSFDVGANGQVRMADPDVKSALIQVLSDLQALVTGYVVFQCVKLLCAVGSRGEEDDAVVSPISERGPAPSFLVHDGLELLLGDIGSRVGGSSVAEDDGWRLAHLCQPGEIILSVHLESDQQALEPDPLLDVELAHHDHAARLHHQSGDFRDRKDSESLGGEILVDGSQRGALAATWSTGDDDFVDGMLSRVPNGVLFNIVLEIDLVERVLELLDSHLLGLQCGLEQGLELLLLLPLLVQMVESGEDSAQQHDLGLVLCDLLNNVSHGFYYIYQLTTDWMSNKNTPK